MSISIVRDSHSGSVARPLHARRALGRDIAANAQNIVPQDIPVLNGAGPLGLQVAGGLLGQPSVVDAVAKRPALFEVARDNTQTGCLCGEVLSSVRRQVGNKSIVRCRGCGLERLTPQPTPQELEALYGEAYFESSDPASPGYAAYGAMEHAIASAADVQLQTLPEFASISHDRRLLDVGCGYGTFVARAADAGWNAHGFDVSSSAAEAALERYGVHVRVGDFASDGAGHALYDVITMWDAIEHFPDPVRALRSAYAALKPGGRLVLSTPDVTCWDARLLGRHWYGYTKVPEHLWFFSRTTLQHLGEQVGFELVEARSWGFVRSFGFCIEKLGLYHPLLGKISRRVTDTFGLTDRQVFFSILDMLMVFERPLEPMDELDLAA
jgi:SAM-dependent methyltransferase